MRTAVEALVAITVGYIIGHVLVYLLVIEPPTGFTFPAFYEIFGRICAGSMVFLYGVSRLVGMRFTTK